MGRSYDRTRDCNSATPTHHEQCEPKHYGIERIAKKLKLQGTQQKTEESDSSRNFRCLETKVARDKYYNDIVLAYSLNYYWDDQ